MSIETAILFQRLSALRWELEPVLRELNMVCAGCPTDSDKQVRGLREELQHAVHHLELTLEHLTRSTTRGAAQGVTRVIRRQDGRVVGGRAISGDSQAASAPSAYATLCGAEKAGR